MKKNLKLSMLAFVTGASIFVGGNTVISHANTRNYEAVQAEAFPELALGRHGIYGVGSMHLGSHGQAHRNMWIGRLMSDYLARNYDGNFDGVFITNQNTFAHNLPISAWQWTPDTEVTRTQVENHFQPAPRNNHFVLHDITGRDLITLLSLQNQMHQPGSQFGTQGQMIAYGVFRGNNVDDIEINGYHLRRYEWFLNNGVQIEDSLDAVYTIAANNFISQNSQRVPFPGDQWGDFLGMKVISAPRSLLNNGQTREFSPSVPNNSNVVTFVNAMAAEIEYRFENEPSTSWATLQTEGSGTATFGVLGEGTAAQTAATTLAPLSPFADRLLSIDGTRVFVNAKPDEGYAFAGWYQDGELISEDRIYSFYHTDDITLTARFIEREPSHNIRIDMLSFADFHGMVDNLMNDDDPGAASFSAFTKRELAVNPGNSFLVAGGDNYHGHPLSTYLRGEPAIRMFDFLGVNYSSFGNHEMSFGSMYPGLFGDQITFLAADLFYTGTNKHPEFVRPYTIVEFEDHDITIGMIGFMTGSMATSTSPVFLAPFDLRTPTLEDAEEWWIEYFEYLIDKLRNEYGVNALVALTHMVPGEARQLARMFEGDFDAIIAGHLHTRYNNVTAGTHIMEPGWHGRTLGRMTFEFDNETGELLELNSSLSANHAIRNFSGHVSVNDDGVETIIPAHPDFENWRHIYEEVAEMMAYYNAVGYDFLNEILAPRGIYGTGAGHTNAQGRAHRDMWINRIVEDYVHRIYSGDMGEFSGIFISNAGGWRNTPTMWNFGPNDPFLMRQLIVTSPFTDHIAMQELTGRDLVTLLSMEQGLNVQNNTFGISSSHISMSGVFRGASIGMENINGHYRPRWEWYLSDGTPVVDCEDVTYVIATRSFVTNGGSRFPFPNNSWGQLLGMTEVQPPRSLLEDGTTIPLSEVPEDPDEQELMDVPVKFLRDMIADELRHRSQFELEDFTSWVYLETNGSGTASIILPLSPFDNRLLNINGTRVFAEATPAQGIEFVGWYVDGVRISEDASFSFQHNDDKTLVAVFSDGEIVAPEAIEVVSTGSGSGFNQLEGVSINGMGQVANVGELLDDEALLSLLIAPDRENNTRILTAEGISTGTTLYVWINENGNNYNKYAVTIHADGQWMMPAGSNRGIVIALSENEL